MLRNLLHLALLALLPVTALAAAHHSPLGRSHHELARRADGNVELFRRVSGAKWSFYNVETGNAGSCGRFHRNSDFTVAMNAGQMNPGLCFKTIRMSYNGKSTTATISDTCPGCPPGGLDLTMGLFSFFAPHSVGIIYGDWDFTDAAPPPPPPPSSTWRPPPPPSSTWTPPPSSTSRARPTTTTQRTTTSTTTSQTSTSSSANLRTNSTTTTTTSINYNTGAASGLATPTGNATVDHVAGQANNLIDLAQAFVRVGAVVMAARNV